MKRRRLRKKAGLAVLFAGLMCTSTGCTQDADIIVSSVNDTELNNKVLLAVNWYTEDGYEHQTTYNYNEKGNLIVQVSRSKDERIIIKKGNNVIYLDEQIKADSNIYNEILEVVLNRYLILMSRATNSMFIWFKDKETEEHFKKFFFKNNKS